MEYGYHVTSFRFDESDADGFVDAFVAHARYLEDAGFSWLTVMDHLWQFPGTGALDDPTVECYAALSALARETESLELSALVTNVHLRHPGLLAKQVASLDSLSDGRATLAIGAGWNEPEYDALGLDFPDASTRVGQMRDAIRLCEAAWNEPSPVDYDGEHYALDGLYLDPKPDEIPVLVGGGGERLTLRAAAEHADHWNVPGVDPETYAHKLGVLADHCEDLGTDYDAIRKSATVSPVLRESEAEAHAAYEAILDDAESGPTPREERFAVGTPADLVDLVGAFDDAGADVFQIEVPQNDRETVERFVEEVMPAVE